MTDVLDPPVVFEHHEEHHEEHGPTGILKWLTSTDHKVIGMSYTVTSVVMLIIGGSFAELIRAQLSTPNNSLVSLAQYNELFTMHGSVMIYLFMGPFAFGALANIIVPIQIGAPDMAFPRLNALSYWLYLTGSITMLSGFFVAGGAANFGWVAYAPLSNSVNTPGAGADLWIGGLLLTGFSAIFTGVNLTATIFYLRAPGMTMFRMPIFTWNLLITAILILLAFPVLTAGLIMLYCDRHFGTHIFSVAGGGVPVLWQNIFWFWRVGSPHVHNRHGPLAVLLHHESSHRGADGYQDVQLDWHDVARGSLVLDRDVDGAWILVYVPRRRHYRYLPCQPPARLLHP